MQAATKARDEADQVRGLEASSPAAHALTRPYAVCTVTVPKTARIAEYGRRLDASIRRAGFAPLRLDLAQDVGVRRLHRPPRDQPDPAAATDPPTRPTRAGPSRGPRDEAERAPAATSPAARRLRPRPAHHPARARPAQAAAAVPARPPDAGRAARAAAGRRRRRRWRPTG